MGLREVKAARTRELLVDTAIDLFIEQGYDATTMEQIAERAEVGTSTLYRYFPSKELLALDPLTRSLDFASALQARPAGEDLGVALGAVIRSALRDRRSDDGRFTALRRIIDAAPVPRARLWDFVASSRSELESVIAERLERSTDDLLVLMTASVTMSVFTITAERWWAGEHSVPPETVADDVLEALSRLDLILPAPTPRL